MQVLNKNTQFHFNDKPNLAKKSLSNRLLKAKRFIEIAKSRKILIVVCN